MVATRGHLGKHVRTVRLSDIFRPNSLDEGPLVEKRDRSLDRAKSASEDFARSLIELEKAMAVVASKHGR